MEWALCKPRTGFARAAVLALGIGSLAAAYGQGSTQNHGNRSNRPYTMAEYNRFAASLHAKTPSEKIVLLDAFAHTIPRDCVLFLPRSDSSLSVSTKTP